MPQKVFTAKNGAKYIKLANGRCKFVKGPAKRKGSKSGKKKGGGIRVGGGMSKFSAVNYS